ncbi:MAG TPA: NAD(P)/FAD-dependent oxidoreductase [Caldilineaceae bacterium]|nr:NAD(P)/FAD-dependent oxidoreductase [Caldilineaceae bacterium]
MTARQNDSAQIIVVGAGIGGLVVAALLARAGLDVTVLEAHTYPGGCAGTFFHQGYRFDAGATLAGGFYPGGPMDRVARAVGITTWPVGSSEPALAVHLPDGASIIRWGDARRHDEYRAAFGEEASRFWRWQEQTADTLWQLAQQTPPWPPQSWQEGFQLAHLGATWAIDRFPTHCRPQWLTDALQPVAAHLRGQSARLRLFIDGQLLISAQATSERANALYAAAALDLPRRGVVHPGGGIGAIAGTLAEAVQTNGGRLLYRQEVSQIRWQEGTAATVVTKRGPSYQADLVVANLPPWNIAQLIAGERPPSLRSLPTLPSEGWGAFVAYIGLDEGVIPKALPLHHQVIVQEPLGEGNSVFLSLSPSWDQSRAPAGHRALTNSTHPDLWPGWQTFQQDRRHYEQRKAYYLDRMLTAAERVLPGLRAAAHLVLPGTPVTFQRYTRRAWGWVGGFPQTNLWCGWGPKLAANLWMVGDSIFPGQSTVGVALGGLRVGRA